MKNKKFKVTLIALALIGVVGVGSTIAYFTAGPDEEVNVFTVGKIHINLDEPKWVEEDGKDMIPGTTIDKNPLITNTGQTDGFIGISVAGMKEMVGGDFVVGLLNETGTGLLNGTNEVFCWNSNFTLVDKNGSIIEAGADDALTAAELDALEGDKLFFAYEAVLPKGDQTPELFTGVQLARDIDTDAAIKISKHFTKADGSIYDPGDDLMYNEGEPAKDGSGNYIYKYTVEGSADIFDDYDSAKAKADEIKEASAATIVFKLTIQGAAIQSLNDSDDNWAATEVWYPKLPVEFLGQPQL